MVGSEPEISDAVFVFSGKMPERIMAAAEIYRRGLTSRIILTRQRRSPAFDTLLQKGIPLPEAIDLARIILVNSGVSEESIEVLPGLVDSTLDEGRALARYAAERKMKTIIAVTSNFHTRRVSMLLRHLPELKKTRIIPLASPHSEFDPENWWHHRSMARELFIEYEKLLFYYLAMVLGII